MGDCVAENGVVAYICTGDLPVEMVFSRRSSSRPSV